MQKYNILELNEKSLSDLQTIAEELGIKKVKAMKKDELVYKILDEQAISYAGIQAEKEKEKEAKKAEKKTKSRKSAKPAADASAEPVAVQQPQVSPSESKPEATVEAKPEKKRRPRVENKKVKDTEKPAEAPVDEPTVVAAPAEEEPTVSPVVAEPSEATPEATRPTEETVQGGNDVADTTTSQTAVQVDTTDPKRMVFRHRDTKSVLDQVFPFSSSAPSNKAEKIVRLSKHNRSLKTPIMSSPNRISRKITMQIPIVRAIVRVGMPTATPTMFSHKRRLMNLMEY